MAGRAEGEIRPLSRLCAARTDRPYVIDHHHLARALNDKGVREVLVSAVANLRSLDKDAFWTFLDTRGWIHPFDEDGKHQPLTALPKSVADLADDPFRSTSELSGRSMASRPDPCISVSV
jgi:hypothetical protein